MHPRMYQFRSGSTLTEVGSLGSVARIPPAGLPIASSRVPSHKRRHCVERLVGGGVVPPSLPSTRDHQVAILLRDQSCEPFPALLAEAIDCGEDELRDRLVVGKSELSTGTLLTGLASRVPPSAASRNIGHVVGTVA
jgi:hypothetical protein